MNVLQAQTTPTQPIQPEQLATLEKETEQVMTRLWERVRTADPSAAAEPCLDTSRVEPSGSMRLKKVALVMLALLAIACLTALLATPLGGMLGTAALIALAVVSSTIAVGSVGRLIVLCRQRPSAAPEALDFAGLTARYADSKQKAALIGRQALAAACQMAKTDQFTLSPEAPEALLSSWIGHLRQSPAADCGSFLQRLAEMQEMAAESGYAQEAQIFEALSQTLEDVSCTDDEKIKALEDARERLRGQGYSTVLSLMERGISRVYASLEQALEGRSDAAATVLKAFVQLGKKREALEAKNQGEVRPIERHDTQAQNEAKARIEELNALFTEAKALLTQHGCMEEREDFDKATGGMFYGLISVRDTLEQRLAAC